jgi:TRAP-type C4-dicarboxylate transport system permease small subunit
MAENAGAPVVPTDAFGRLLFAIARALAILGGVLACVIAAMVTVSVTGRYLFSAPIPGDYDLVGILAGVAVFAFLPYCQMIRGNIVVDFFTNSAPPRVRSAMDTVGTLLFLGIAVLFTWRLYHGAFELYDSHQVIAAFNFFRWWTVPLNIVCMIVLILTIAYSLVRDFRAVRTRETRGASTVAE